jgi:ABC-type antimicrobial peptide transport system permease subunit
LSVRAKTGIAPELLTKSIVAAIAGVNPQVGVTFRPLARQLDSSLMRERLVAELAGFLGVVALVLAALGLYGVTAYSIHRRRNEIGIRMALGATHRRVVALLLTRVSLLVGSGMALGIAMSFWASRVIAGLLYGASPYDPLTLLGSMAVLLTVTGLAAWLPARQAGRIDPARVMRGT